MKLSRGIKIPQNTFIQRIPKMKILILGADGYLGWSMAANLFSSSHDLFLVDNYSKRKYMKVLKRYPY